MQQRILAILAIVVMVAGCLTSPGSEPRTYWGEGGPGAPGLQTGRNFYSADLDRYPGFAIFSHNISEEAYTADVESGALMNGITLCRSEFGSAFSSDAVVAFDSHETHKNDWIPLQQHFVPFRPDWVVVVLFTREHDGSPDDPLLPSYTVGYVFQASDFFDASISPARLLQSGFRDEHPVHLDIHATFPGYRNIYSVIERFRAGNALYLHSPKAL